MSRRSSQIENKSKKTRIPYLLIMPGTIILLALYGYPIILTFIQSFNKINLLSSEMEFIGLANYKGFISDPEIIKSIQITFKYTIVTVLLKLFLGFLFAYLLYSNIYLKKLNRFLVLIPWAIPQVAVATIWKWILNGNYGYLNYYLQKLGVIDVGVNFLSNPRTAFYLVSFVDAWIGVPLVCMMFLAGLEQIPNSLYEAAEMDGAGGFRKFIDISLPGIKKVFMTVTILVTIWTFNSFNVIFMLTEGGPMRSTETLIMKVYQEAFSRFNIGLAASLSIFSVIILIILSSIYVKGFKENES